MSNIITPLPRLPLGTPLNPFQETAKGLVYYWRGIPGQKAFDESGHGNHGTINGATWQGDGLLFDGSGDEVLATLSSGLVAGGPITIICIARQTTANLECLVNVQAATGSAGQLGTVYLDGGNEVVFGRDESPGKGQQSTAIDTSIWHHYACTYLEVVGKGDIYVDGVLVNANLTLLLGDFNPNMISIGAGLSATFDFTGDISHVSIYNRVLSQSEISALTINPELPMAQDPISLIFSPAAGIATGMYYRTLLQGVA